MDPNELPLVVHADGSCKNHPVDSGEKYGASPSERELLVKKDLKAIAMGMRNKQRTMSTILRSDNFLFCIFALIED